jgi:hypothetical protein
MTPNRGKLNDWKQVRPALSDDALDRYAPFIKLWDDRTGFNEDLSDEEKL